MKTYSRAFLAAATIAMTYMAVSAHGAIVTGTVTVTQLTGGDANEGFNAAGLIPVTAVDYNDFSSGTTVWQGITFQATQGTGGTVANHSTTMTWGHNAGTFTGSNDTGTADDNALKALLNFGYFAGHHNGTTFVPDPPRNITFAGLSADTYQVNLFMYAVAGDPGRSTYFDVVGDGQPAMGFTVERQAWNVQIPVTLTSAGSISIDIWGDNYNPVVSAALLSIPEPASLSLLALGGLALIRRRRA